MSYQVLARKWRPRLFGEMVGQTHVLQALINALDNDRLHHAYLFAGTRGVGKTTIARIFAKSLNCEKGVSSTPCGECSACREIDEGRFVDLIEVDAASRTKVEDTRDLLENVQYAPTVGRYKVYLIDEVHMFSNSSFNALLKTLEEPPPHVKFLLATTDPKKLPVTILSRCLQFNLKRLAPDQIEQQVEYLLTEEKIESDKQSRHLISVSADGSLRDALSLLDQAVSYGGGVLRATEVSTMLGTIDHQHIQDLLEDLVALNGEALLKQVRNMEQYSPDYAKVLGELLSMLQRMAVCQVVEDSSALEDDEVIRRLATQISAEDCQLFYQTGLIGQRDLYLAPSARTGFEMVLLRMLAFSQAEVVVGTDSPRVARPAPGKPSATAEKKTEESVVPVARSAPRSEATGVSVTRADEPATQKTTAAPPQSEHEMDWRELIDTLGLTALARELASHCVLIGRQGREIKLQLAADKQHVMNPVAQGRLQEKLAAHFGDGTKLSIQIEATVETETPAMIMQQEKQEQLDVAEQAIKSDPFVQALCDTFDATLDRESIQPTQENK